MQVDTSGWSGEGTFTQALVDVLATLADVTHVKVEDSPASRAETGYAFLSNEIYVEFAEREREERSTWLGIIPRTRHVRETALDLEGLEAVLARHAEIGPADYVDSGMIQYLKAERIIPPYQTRGYKLVEMVRVYRFGDAPRPRQTEGDR